MATGISIYQSASEELTIAVNNDNTDRMRKVLNEAATDEERKSLANIRDPTTREPVVDIAIRRKNLAAFDLLAEAGAYLQGEKSFHGPDEPMHIAAKYGSIDISIRMLEKGIKPRPNLKSMLPSHIAMRYNNRHLAEIFAEKEKAASHSNASYLRKGGKMSVAERSGSKGAIFPHNRSKDRS
jgi:ankyrin repeat protein